jgi:hypothetical protein
MMQLVKFLKDAASNAARLSRETLDLKTSSELRMMSEQLKKKAFERERTIVAGAVASFQQEQLENRN